MSSRPAAYTNIAAMEPMLPGHSRAELAELSCEIFKKSGLLTGQVPARINLDRIAALILQMNSYYSNLIEGHKTLPQDIERALARDYSSDSTKRANQELGRAHVEVEQLMIDRLNGDETIRVHSADFLTWLHREFYTRLPEELHFSETRHGKRYRIEPGNLRTFEVEVGRHQPPHHGAVSKFLNRFEAFYSNPKIHANNQLIALAAAHHRLAWIHPFGDGNGRVGRLYSHACLRKCGVDSHGLWPLSRGLARAKEDYYGYLSSADSTRRNDTDGRGNLSDRALAEFCRFFLKVILDQIEFMSDRLKLDHLATRMERYLAFGLPHVKPRDLERLSRLLKAALYEGAIERGRVGEIVGLSPTAARKLLRVALDENLLESPSEKTPVSLVFASKTLNYYFPDLFF